RVLKLVSLFNLLFQPLVGLEVLKISPDVIDSLGDPVPELQVDRRGSVLGYLLAQHLAKAFRGVVIGGESHNGELFREKVVLGEIAKRGKQFAFRQVAGCAKNNHHAGRSSRIRIGVVRDHSRNSLSPSAKRLLKSLVPRLLFNVSAELETHRGQYFRRKIIFATRCKPLKQRCGQNGRGCGRFDGGEDGPAAFARIGDAAREAFERRLIEQGNGRQIE